MVKKKIFISSIAATLLFTGCSVTPQPMNEQKIYTNAKNEYQKVVDTELKVTGPISVEEAIARALHYNREKRVSMMRSTLSKHQLDLITYEMLPQLTTNAGYAKRSEYDASASTSFVNGVPQSLGATPNYSISQDKQSMTADISFSWNVLDFGLSYIRAKQQADRYLITKEQTKKAVQNLASDVRRSYYRAVAADKLLKDIKPIIKEVKKALSDSDNIAKLKLNSPINALGYQRELLDILRSLQNLEQNLVTAKVELTRMMGLKPGTEFELAEKVKDWKEIPKFEMSIKEMEKVALQKRPELMEGRYKIRLSKEEITAAKLEMLPGVGINAGLNYDDSDYILHNDWFSYGLNASWNILNVFKQNSLQKQAQSKIELAKEQQLAMVMGVLSQVHLSYIKYHQTIKEFELASKYKTIAKDILKHTQAAIKAHSQNRLTLIKEQLNNVLATLRFSSAYAQLQDSYGKLYMSMGIDPKDSFAQINSFDFDIKQKNSHAPIDKETLKQQLMQEIRKELRKEFGLKKNNKEAKESSSQPSSKTDAKQQLLTKQVDTAKLKKTLINPGEKLVLNDKEYTVKKGDNIGKIAKQNGIELRQILVQNPWLYEKSRVIGE